MKIASLILALAVTIGAAQAQYYNPYRQQTYQAQPVQMYVPQQAFQNNYSVPVQGYTNSYGTQVQPYVRSQPDGNPYNNNRPPSFSNRIY